MTIEQLLELLLNTAMTKGQWLRWPARFEVKPDIAKTVGFACTELDRLGCKWGVQNTILDYVNNADQRDVWGKMYSTSFRRIVRDAIKKG